MQSPLKPAPEPPDVSETLVDATYGPGSRLAYKTSASAMFWRHCGTQRNCQVLREYLSMQPEAASSSKLIPLLLGLQAKPQVTCAVLIAGVDVIFDPVGGTPFAEALKTLKWGGQIAIIGFASGTIPKVSCHCDSPNYLFTVVKRWWTAAGVLNMHQIFWPCLALLALPQ